MTAFALAIALAACAAAQEVPADPAAPCPGLAAPGAAWRAEATDDDRRRLRGWRDAWDEALAEAGAAGHTAAIAAEGPLLDPDAALAGAAPPPGDYDCRTIKLGSPQGLLPYVAYPAFRCRIRADEAGLAFVKLTGSQRPVGRLYPDGARRMVFLGSLQLGDESRAYEYGRDRDRDMIGALERVGERRWRLVFPSPRFESRLDVIELIPRR